MPAQIASARVTLFVIAMSATKGRSSEMCATDESFDSLAKALRGKIVPKIKTDARNLAHRVVYAIDRSQHAFSAAIRNSRLPSPPSMGDGVTPITCHSWLLIQPAISAQIVA